MESVIKLSKKVRVTAEIPISIYIFSKEQFNSFNETNRVATAFSWLFNITLDVAIGAWFSLKQTGLDLQTSLILQTVLWTCLILSLLFGAFAAWYAWKNRKIQNELTSQRIRE